MIRFAVSLWLHDISCYHDVSSVVDAPDAWQAIQLVMRMRYIRFARWAEATPVTGGLPVEYEHVQCDVPPATLFLDSSVYDMPCEFIARGYPHEGCDRCK